MMAWSLSFDEWRLSQKYRVEKFSEDLARVLLQMAAWLDMVNLPELTLLLTKSNKELLMWFQ
jgi:hypothetical protein